MCGPFVWGFWWILPLMGAVMCLGMLLLASRRVGGGQGCLWMLGHRGRPEDGADQTGERGRPR